MRRVLLVLVAAFALTFGLGSNCKPTPVITDILNCAGAQASEAMPDLIPIVASVLVSGGMNPAIDAALMGLVGRFGLDMIDCVVTAILDAWKAPASQPALKALPTFDTLRITRGTTRGEAWLKTRGQGTRTVGAAAAP